MTEQIIPPEASRESRRARPSIFAQMRKFSLTLVLLAAGWFFFAQVVPRMLFTEQQRKSAEHNASPAITDETPDTPPTANDTPATEIASPAAEPPAETPAEAPTPAAHAEINTPPAPAANNFSEKNTEALEARIAALEDTIHQLQASTAHNASVSPETIRTMQEKLAAQEEQTQTMKQELNSEQQAAWQITALWQAYGTLSEDARSGNSFMDALLRFSNLAPDSKDMQQALDTLLPYAENGIVTLDFLRDNFADIIPEALRPAAEPAHDASTSNQLSFNLSSLVRIRKVGKPQGTTPDAVIARAESALKEGDVSLAFSEINSLPDDTRSAFQAWQEHAQSYLIRDKALNTLRHALMVQTESAQPKGITR